MANVKGSALAARFRFVEARYGDEGLKRLLAALDPADRKIHDAVILSSNWYPFESFVRITTAVDRQFGKGDLALVHEIARYAADANLTTLYKFFYSVSSVAFILSMAARLWRMNYDAGALQVDSQPKRAVLEIAGWPEPHRAHCLSVIGWSTRSAELSGAKDVRYQEPFCRARGDARCQFEMTWS